MGEINEDVVKHILMYYEDLVLSVTFSGDQFSYVYDARKK
jgi:hypothetical protein